MYAYRHWWYLALAVAAILVQPSVMATEVLCNGTESAECGWNSLCQSGLCQCLGGFSSLSGTDCTEDRCQPGYCYTCLDDARCSRCVSVVTFGTGECVESCQDGSESLVLQGDYMGRVCTPEATGLSPAHLAIIGFVCGAAVVAALLCIACWYHQKRQNSSGHLKILKTANAYRMNDSPGNNNSANGGPSYRQQPQQQQPQQQQQLQLQLQQQPLQPRAHEIYKEKSKAVRPINQCFQEENKTPKVTSNGGAIIAGGRGHRVVEGQGEQVVRLGVNSVVFDEEFVHKVALLRPHAPTFLEYLNQVRRRYRQIVADDTQEVDSSDGQAMMSDRQPANDRQAAMWDRQPANDRQATMRDRQPANDRQATTSVRQPTNDRQATMNVRQPANDRQATMNVRQPANERQGTTGHKQPANDRQATTSDRQPANDGQTTARAAEVEREARALSSAMACLTRLLFILNKREENLSPAPSDGIQLADWAFKLLQPKHKPANGRVLRVHRPNPEADGGNEFQESQLI